MITQKKSVLIMIWSPQYSTLKKKSHSTYSYMSKAEITMIRNTKGFLSKKSTNRSGHSNLEKILLGEHNKNLIKSQMITEIHKTKTSLIIFHNSRTRNYQKEEIGQLLLWDILPQVIGQENSAILIWTHLSHSADDRFTNARYTGGFRWTSSSENPWITDYWKGEHAVFLVLFT